MEDKVEIIRVAGSSPPASVAGAIAGVIRQHDTAMVQAIGASAINQAVKSFIIARGYLKDDGLDIRMFPYFVTVEINGQERTAVRFSVESHARKSDETHDTSDTDDTDETSDSSGMNESDGSSDSGVFGSQDDFSESSGLSS